MTFQRNLTQVNFIKTLLYSERVEVWSLIRLQSILMWFYCTSPWKLITKLVQLIFKNKSADHRVTKSQKLVYNFSKLHNWGNACGNIPSINTITSVKGLMQWNRQKHKHSDVRFLNSKWITWNKFSQQTMKNMWASLLFLIRWNSFTYTVSYLMCMTWQELIRKRRDMRLRT